MKSMHVKRLPNETMHEHDCNGDGCLTGEQINNLHTLAWAERDELKIRIFHKILKKRFYKTTMWSTK